MARLSSWLAITVGIVGLCVIGFALLCALAGLVPLLWPQGLHVAKVLLETSFAIGVVGVVLSLVGWRSRSRARTAIGSSLAAINLIGPWALFVLVALGQLDSERSQREHDAVFEFRGREVPAVSERPGTPIEMSALAADWTRDHDRTDREYVNRVLVAHGPYYGPAFDEHGTRYFFPVAESRVHAYVPNSDDQLYLDPQASLPSETLTCLYGGTVARREAGGESEAYLHLYGCRFARARVREALQSDGL